MVASGDLLGAAGRQLWTRDTLIARNDTVHEPVLVVGATVRVEGVLAGDVAGVGADFVRIDFDDAVSAADSEASVLLELHAGAGVEISLGPLSVIADVRYCSVEGMSDAAVREALGHDYDASGWYASLSAGVSF